MWQPRCTHHQRKRDGKNIKQFFGRLRIGLKAQIHQRQVKLAKHRQARPVCHRGTQSQLRHGIAGNQDRDKNSRYHVGKDQHTILSHLRIGNALHTAQHSIGEDNTHADHHAQINIHLKKAREDNPDTPHLPGDIRKRHKEQTDNGHNTRST